MSTTFHIARNAVVFPAGVFDLLRVKVLSPELHRLRQFNSYVHLRSSNTGASPSSLGIFADPEPNYAVGPPGSSSLSSFALGPFDLDNTNVQLQSARLDRHIRVYFPGGSKGGETFRAAITFPATVHGLLVDYAHISVASIYPVGSIIHSYH